jgi:hypothetical protein
MEQILTRLQQKHGNALQYPQHQKPTCEAYVKTQTMTKYMFATCETGSIYPKSLEHIVPEYNKHQAHLQHAETLSTFNLTSVYSLCPCGQ